MTVAERETVVVQATAEEARELTDRIKLAVDGTWHLVKQAYESRAWSALGYWTRFYRGSHVSGSPQFTAGV